MRLVIENLTKKYGSLTALADISLEMKNGIYGLLGPNGAGKSTLMQILTGNLKADGGRILFEGREILSMGKAYRKLIGYMPQDIVCYPHFTLMEFMEYMALLKGMDPGEDITRQQIDGILSQVHLEEVKNKRLSGFSGGMKRRAMLSQAILGNPQILILDEPTAGLDPRERIAMRNMIARLSRDRIVLLATHIASDVECIADRIIILKQGRLVVEGQPAALIAQVKKHVKTVYCTSGELEQLQEHALVGSYFQTEQGFAVHLITGEGSKDLLSAQETSGFVSLDEVYLYYCESKF